MEDANEKEPRSIRLQGLCECQRDGGRVRNRERTQKTKEESEKMVGR